MPGVIKHSLLTSEKQHTRLTDAYNIDRPNNNERWLISDVYAGTVLHKACGYSTTIWPIQHSELKPVIINEISRYFTRVHKAGRLSSLIRARRPLPPWQSRARSARSCDNSNHKQGIYFNRTYWDKWPSSSAHQRGKITASKCTKCVFSRGYSVYPAGGAICSWSNHIEIGNRYPPPSSLLRCRIC